MTDKPVSFSVLDLAPIPQGSSAKEAFSHSLDLAQLAEKRGYHRYWLAEHHNMVGIASAATSVLIGYLAANTTTLHLGSGGVMLPNHSPLVIAEQLARSIRCTQDVSISALAARRAAISQPCARCVAI